MLAIPILNGLSIRLLFQALMLLYIYVKKYVDVFEVLKMLAEWQ